MYLVITARFGNISIEIGPQTKWGLRDMNESVLFLIIFCNNEFVKHLWHAKTHISNISALQTNPMKPCENYRLKRSHFMCQHNRHLMSKPGQTYEPPVASCF